MRACCHFTIIFLFFQKFVIYKAVATIRWQDAYTYFPETLKSKILGRVLHAGLPYIQVNAMLFYNFF